MLNRVDNRPFAGECLVFGFARHGEHLAIVVESDFGVAGLITGDCEHALIEAAQERFAGATFDQDETVMRPTLEAVSRLLADPGVGLPLALDLRGSPAELAVPCHLLHRRHTAAKAA